MPGGRAGLRLRSRAPCCLNMRSEAVFPALPQLKCSMAAPVWQPSHGCPLLPKGGRHAVHFLPMGERQRLTQQDSCPMAPSGCIALTHCNCTKYSATARPVHRTSLPLGKRATLRCWTFIGGAITALAGQQRKPPVVHMGRCHIQGGRGSFAADSQLPAAVAAQTLRGRADMAGSLDCRARGLCWKQSPRWATKA